MERRDNRIAAAVIRAFGGLTRDEAAHQEETRARAAYAAGFREAWEPAQTGNDEPPLSDSAGRPIASGYRAAKGLARDLSSVSQTKAIEAAYRLWNTNPLSGALTEIIVDYVLGDGIIIQAETEEIQEALDRFWNDPVNDLALAGAEAIVRELSMYGEQVILTFPRTGEDTGGKADGLLRLGAADPATIVEVITAKENHRDLLALRLKGADGGDRDGPVYKIVRQEEAHGPLAGLPIGGGAGSTLKEGRAWRVTEQGASRGGIEDAGERENLKFEGECFYFRQRVLSSGVRGRPEQLALLDWLDRFDQLFFDGAEHVALLNTVVWDLEVEGGSADAREPERNLTHQGRILKSMKPNSAYVHNERTKLEVRNPSLQSADLETIIRQLRVFIAGGMRVPEHWISEGGYTNRATAEEMGRPTYRMLRRRQEHAKQLFTRLCQYQIDILVTMKQMPEEVEVEREDGPTEKRLAREAFELVMPPVSERDSATASATFERVVNAVLKARAASLVTLEDAIKLIAIAAELMGLEVDVQATLDQAEGAATGMGALDDLLAKIDRDRDEEPSGANGRQKQEEPEDEEPEAIED